jgi:hypothetical protein
MPKTQTNHTNITTHANPETRPHAEHSPSSIKHFEVCPSFKGRSGTNAIAEAGTRIHEAIEKRNPSLLIDPVEQDLANICLDFLDGVRADKSQSAKLIRTVQEIRLDIRLGENSTFGTSDLLDIYEEADGRHTGVAMDWKTGYGAVEDAEENAQVACYALGFLQKFPELEKIDFYLVLPRRQEVSLATFTRDDIPRLRLRLSTVIARAKELAGVEFHPKEGTCDYCAYQGSCKALAGRALVIAQKEGFQVPANINLRENSPAEKAELYKLAALLEDWAAATKKELLRQSLEEGLEMPNYRLDQRKTPRTIENPLVGFAAVSEMITFEEFLTACTRVSVPALEKIVAEKAGKGQKAHAKHALEDALRDKGALKEEGVIHVLKPVRN